MIVHNIIQVIYLETPYAHQGTCVCTLGCSLCLL